MTEDLLVCASFPNEIFDSLDTSLPYFLNAALNVSLAVATTVANLVVLLAMRRVTSIRLPSKLLLCSLVLTDLGAGSLVQPQWAAFLFLRGTYPNHVPCSLYRSITVTASMSNTASLLTLAAISLDRYAALFFHLKYHQIVTTRRVSTVLAFTWTLALLLALVSLWEHKLWQASLVTVFAIALLVIFVTCIKIFHRLRAPHIQPQVFRPSAATGGKHTEHGEVQKNSVRHDVGHRISLDLLPPFLVFVLIQSSSWMDRPQRVSPSIQLHTSFTELVLESLPILLSAAWNPHWSRETSPQTILPVKRRSLTDHPAWVSRWP